MKRDLKEAILDIANGLKPDYDPMYYSEPVEKVGPNNWEQVGPADFGPQWDYETYDIGEHTYIYAVSEAALQWCYKFLPQGLDRWRDRGFKVETRWLHLIQDSMDDDGLMSEQEFTDAMNENEQIMRQGDE